jgi:hypothetical protein
MKKMKLAFFLVLAVLCSKAMALEFAITCNQDKALEKFVPVEGSGSGSECESFEKNGYDCFDTFKAAKDQKYISLGTPVNGYHSGRKSSDLFLRNIIEETVKTSLELGLDPYAVLAITLMENAPTPGFQAYAFDYGIPPIDVLTFRKTWGCSFTSDQQSRPNILISRPLISKGLKKMTTVMCEISPPNVKKWDSPNLQIGEVENGCCAKVTHYMADPYELMRKVKSYTALVYVKKYFGSVLKSTFVTKTENPAERLALLLQAYNGYGVIGANEKTTNSCLNGVKMSDTPVYGAGAADILLNVLMANAEVRLMVTTQNAFTKHGPIPSYLCQIFGEGEHRIDALTFSKMQFEYLKGRKQCGPVNFDFKDIKRIENID